MSKRREVDKGAIAMWVICVGIVLGGFIGGYFLLQHDRESVWDGVKSSVKEAYSEKDAKDLSQGTIDNLSNADYERVVNPSKLKEMVSSGKEVYAYFYSPDCIHCQGYTPLLNEVVDENGYDYVQMNVLEYMDEFQNYSVQGTPTLIYFKDGTEVARSVGVNGEGDPTIEKEYTKEFFEGTKDGKIKGNYTPVDNGEETVTKVKK